MRPRSPIAAAAWVALLPALLGLAYWGYGAYMKRELNSAVLALVADATVRLRNALEARNPGAATRERLDGHFKALAAATQRLSGLEIRRNPPLTDAAQQYLDEVRALLRRQIAVQRGRDAVLTDVNALSLHIRAARGRSSDWIRQAIELKQQMDRDVFDYRLAEGGLQKSFQTLRDARSRLAPLVAPAPLIEDRPLNEARTRLTEESAQLERQVEAARQLPVAR